MTPERRQRVREVFATVADLTPEARERALQETCAGDSELRSGVESLLDRHDSLGGTTPASDPLLAPGDIVSERFRVQRVIGSGGMGEVYECEDTTLGQPVALKALRPTAAGSDAAERFKREIQIARSITHPNVCRVYEYGQHATATASIDYFIMEYVAGKTLAELLKKRGKLSLEEATPLIQQMAAGLEALHDSGVVHRDLKPGNILLEERSEGRFRVVLTDFGVAGPIGERRPFGSFATVSGQVMGTPQYMAPEQLTGMAAGPSTDLFALGIVLYELLTGEQPFPDKNRRTDPPKPPSAWNPDVTPEIDRLILSCLEIDLSKRPNSIDAVFEVFGVHQTRSRDSSRAATVAMPTEPPVEPPAPPPAPARPWLEIGLAALAVALLALGLRLFLQTPSPVEGRRVAVLPFVVASGGVELQLLADGLMDSITSRLSQYEGLNDQLLVVPASEVYKVGIKRADAAGGSLGVNSAVEGQMSAQDDRIRLTLTLIDTQRKVQEGTAVINGFRSKALDLEDEAVIRLANMLDLHALPEQVDSIAVVAPGAQEFYLQGKGYLQRSDGLDSVNHAIQLFEKAISLDASYARAYAGLSKAYLYKRDRTTEAAWVLEAAEASRRAVELAPQLIETQTARGYALLAQGESDEALQSFKAALEINPRSADAYAGLGKAYDTRARQLKTEKEQEQSRNAAESAYLKAISLRPNDWVSYKRLGLFYADNGGYTEAIEQYKIVVELAPDNAHAFVNLGIFSHYVGDEEAARHYLEKTLQLDPNRVSALTSLGTLKSSADDIVGAIEMYERALQVNDQDQGTWGNLAGAYRKLNRHEEADDAYRKAITILHARAAIEGESPSTDSKLAHHYAGLGDFEASRRHAAAASSSNNPADQLNIAIALSRAGDTPGARAALRRCIDAGRPIEDLQEIEALEKILPGVID